MQLFEKNTETDTVIVAEIGVNHEGDLDKALELIELAAKAGADAVKFQTYTPSRYACANDAERLARTGKFALDMSDWVVLKEKASSLNIGFFSTPLSEDVVSDLDPLCPVFKIASGDITFEPVVRAAAATGKPLLVSTGCATLEEIDAAVRWVQEEAKDAPLQDRLALLHCVAAYPTAIEEANVRSIPFLAERYGVTVGYSNHVIGMEACLAAIALGAPIIEVHFTDQKEGRSFRDHELSMDFGDLKRLVETAPLIRHALGDFGKFVQPGEEGTRLLIRKGVVAAQDLNEGDILSEDNLMYARPATEFASSEIGALMGRKLTASVKMGELIPRAAVSP